MLSASGRDSLWIAIEVQLGFVDVEEPGLAVVEVLDDGGVGGFAEGAEPDDGGVLGVGGVKDPFIVQEVAGFVLDEDQVMAGLKLRVLRDEVGAAETEGIGWGRGGGGDCGGDEPGAY